jgi:hypothetical protein
MPRILTGLTRLKSLSMSIIFTLIYCSEITFLDFCLIGTTAFMAPPAPAAPPTLVEVAREVTTAVQTHLPDPKDFGNAVVAALGTARLISGAGAGRGSGASGGTGGEVCWVQHLDSTCLTLLVYQLMLITISRPRCSISLSPRLH